MFWTVGARRGGGAPGGTEGGGQTDRPPGDLVSTYRGEEFIQMGFPSQCSRSGFIGVAGRSVSPGTIEALAGEAGGPYALVGRWGRWVLSAGRGLGDE